MLESKREQRAGTAVVMQTHYLSRALMSWFADLRQAVPGYDAYILMHLPAGERAPELLSTVPHHFVTTPEIRNPEYGRKAGGPNWHIWRGGNTDLIALSFINTHNTYKYYWFVEYDVRFSGAWADLFGFFEDSDVDLLSTTLFRRPVNPAWMHWPSLHVPEGTDLSKSEQIGNFMPIYRISRRGADAIDHAYRSGWAGHCEVTWPTILHRAGFGIEDLGGDGEFVCPGNRNRFYTNVPQDPNLVPGSLVCRPARLYPGRRRNQLWHPIKPLHHKLREDARSAIKRCLALARSANVLRNGHRPAVG